MISLKNTAQISCCVLISSQKGLSNIKLTSFIAGEKCSEASVVGFNPFAELEKLRKAQQSRCHLEIGELLRVRGLVKTSRQQREITASTFCECWAIYRPSFVVLHPGIFAVQSYLCTNKNYSQYFVCNINNIDKSPAEPGYFWHCHLVSSLSKCLTYL